MRHVLSDLSSWILAVKALVLALCALWTLLRSKLRRHEHSPSGVRWIKERRTGQDRRTGADRRKVNLGHTSERRVEERRKGNRRRRLVPVPTA